MAYPPVIPPATRANSTTQLDNHPGDHNALSAALANMPWGEVAQISQKVTAPTGVGSTTTPVPALSGLAFTAIAGRRYRVDLRVHIAASAVSILALLVVSIDATMITRCFVYTAPFATYTTSQSAMWEGPISAGAHTLNTTLQMAGGSGTVGMDGATDFSYLTITDIGHT